MRVSTRISCRGGQWCFGVAAVLAIGTLSLLSAPAWAQAKPAERSTSTTSSESKRKTSDETPEVATAEAPSSQPASRPTKAQGPFPIPDGFPRPARVVTIALHEEVSLGMASFVERVAQTLKKGDVLLVDIKTFGGRVDAAVTIRDALLHLGQKGVRTVAYVNPRAISAGALIAYATDLIVVAPGATMGAATPIQVGGGGEAKPVEEKVVSYMRKEMRSTARARGRRGDVAEAMVDADVEVAGLVKKGKLLTLDGEAALQWGVASYQVSGHDALLAKLGYDAPGTSHTLAPIRASWAEKIASWLSSSAVSGLLMTIGMLGLMIGLYSGGSPVPLTVGATCLLLFFFGHYVTQLAGIEDLLLFFLGVGLIVVEVFVPGTFLPGALGILCIIAALFLGLVDFERVPIDVQWETGLIGSALTVVFGSLLATVVLAAMAVKMLPRSALGRPLILQTALAAGAGRGSDNAVEDSVVGQGGSAVTDLRPSGKVVVGGRRYDARAEVGFVAAGAPIRVVKRQGLELVVSLGPEVSSPVTDADPAKDEPR
jgi:membrane-bound serine protease (ClpP class)